MVLLTLFIVIALVLPSCGLFLCGKRLRLRNAALYSSVENRKGLPIQNAPLPGDFSVPSAAQIFVCTNKNCRDKGSDSTMETFTFLTPESVQVIPVNCLGNCNKGPNARILTPSGAFVEASMLRSVEKVVEVLQSTLQININQTSAEVLRLNYEGNVYLRAGELDQAIDCYDKALQLNTGAGSETQQNGILLLMRGTALLQRAYVYKLRYRDMMKVAQEVLVKNEDVSKWVDAFHSPIPLLGEGVGVGGWWWGGGNFFPNLLSSAQSSTSANPITTLSSSALSIVAFRERIVMDMLRRVHMHNKHLDSYPKWSDLKSKWPGDKEPPTKAEDLLDKVYFTSCLYQQSLTRALQDLLTCTTVLPSFPQAWRRIGDVLGEMLLFRQAIECYEAAIKLDSGLYSVLLGSVEKMKVLEKLVEKARGRGVEEEVVAILMED
eukprot:gene31275-37795_t